MTKVMKDKGVQRLCSWYVRCKRRCLIVCFEVKEVVERGGGTKNEVVSRGEDGVKQNIEINIFFF
jgi:hypothetical protein